MSGLENDDYVPHEGHSVSGGKVRRSKHIEAGGPGGRPGPGQRGKNKREHGEKPVVTVKWNQQLTEALWILIKTKPELKRVLVNEPTRFLGPHGAAGSLFSKKDLQKTIAEQLFNDGTYDLGDQMIMDNLTRAVKNKLHKTQMLYEASLRDLPPEFTDYQSELEIPPAQRAKWTKVKDRFPTYFEYHELAQEIPAIAKEMEVHAQQFGAWKAKALSGSEEGSPNSFISNNRGRSRSIDTSASWDVPDSPPLMNLHSGGDQDFEVLPPPADSRATFSDIESYGGGANAALGGISPGVSPSLGAMPLQRTSFHVDPANRWSPNQPGSMMSLGPGQIGAAMHNGARGSNDGVSPVWTHSGDHIVPSQLSLETQVYDPNGLQSGGPWSNQPSPLVPGNTGPRYPFNNVSPNAMFNDEMNGGLHLTAQSLAQAGGSDNTPRKHERGPSMSKKGTNLRSVSPQGTSPFSPEYSSSGSPEMPGSADSPRDERDMDALLQILREREKRKKQRDEEWLRFKQKKLEDRERQRIENQREREENEKRRQHEVAMMDRKIQMLQLEAQLRQQQGDMQSGSVATSGSNMASPVTFTNGGSTNMNDNHHEMQYPDNMSLFQQLSSNQLSQYDQHVHSLAMTGPSHPISPIHMNQPLQQTSQQQQQQRMSMLGMSQFHQSPITHPGELRSDAVNQMSLDSSLPSSFHQEQYNDSQLEEIFGSNM